MEILINHLRVMKQIGTIASIDSVVAIQLTPGYLNVIATDWFIIRQYRLPVTGACYQQDNIAPFAISPMSARIIGYFAQQILDREPFAKPAQVEIANSLSIACDGIQVSAKMIDTPTTIKIVEKMNALMAYTPLDRLKINVKRALKKIKPGRLSQLSPATVSIVGNYAAICYADNKWSVSGTPLSDSTMGGATAVLNLTYLMDAIRSAEEIDSTVIIGMSDDKSPIFVGDDKSEGIRFSQFIMPILIK